MQGSTRKLDAGPIFSLFLAKENPNLGRDWGFQNSAWQWSCPSPEATGVRPIKAMQMAFI